MNWTRVAANIQASDTGCQVTRVKVGAAWRYVAWGPDAAPGWSSRAFALGKCQHWAGAADREHYPSGVPIPERHPLLGVRQSAADARVLCAQHAARPVGQQNCG